VKTTNLLLCPEKCAARREGRLTQHRVPVKFPYAADWKPTWQGVEETTGRYGAQFDAPRVTEFIRCPVSPPGSRIRWLTTWAVDDQFDKYRPLDLGSDPDDLGPFWSRHDSAAKPEWAGRLRSGLSLPSFLRDRMPVDEVVSARCERVQSISEEDAKMEGLRAEQISILRMAGDSPSIFVRSYAHLWNRLHGPGAWEANPWVWIYEFKPITK